MRMFVGDQSDEITTCSILYLESVVEVVASTDLRVHVV